MLTVKPKINSSMNDLNSIWFQKGRNNATNVGTTNIPCEIDYVAVEETVNSDTNVFYKLIVDILNKKQVIAKILIHEEGCVFYIWSLLRENNTGNRYKVYEQERELIKLFSGTQKEFYFDFNIVNADEVDYLLTCGAKVIYE